MNYLFLFQHRFFHHWTHCSQLIESVSGLDIYKPLRHEMHPHNLFVWTHRNMSLVSRMRLTIKERGGFLGLYRGIGPGTIRSFLANGTSMIVMVHAQKKVTEWGWRDSADSKLDEEEE